MAQVVPAEMPPLHQRPVKNTICLFDVDGTLTPARGSISPEMHSLLTRLRHQVAIGFVGGSDLAKQQEQLGIPKVSAIELFDFCFAENGLTAYRLGEPISSQSFIQWLGDEKYKKLVNFCLRYVADLDIPVKRGTFVEFRNGMVNISPIGRNASKTERLEYEKFDLQNGIRRQFIKAIQQQFPDLGLTYSIGGQISFDVFPKGWDKTYCLQHVEAEASRPPPDGVQYSTIHFFGDKTYEGGNDYEIYTDKRVIGHSVSNPEDTAKILKELFPSVA